MQTRAIKAKYPGFELLMLVHVENALLSDILYDHDGFYYTGNLVAYDILLHPGDFVIDGGANIGWYSLFAAHKVGRSGIVVAIEPDARNTEVLRENIRYTGLPQVRVIEGALGEELGQTRLFVKREDSDDSFLSNLFTETADFTTSTVPMVTLAEIIKEQGRMPRLIKLDIQGAEPQALSGLGVYAQVGNTDRSFIICEFSPGCIMRAGNSPFEILAFIEKYQYVPYRVAGNQSERKLFTPVSIQDLLRVIELERNNGEGFWDMLFVPRERLNEWEFLAKQYFSRD